MTARPMSDAQLAASLRAHLPSQPATGLQDRIVAEVRATPQDRRLPAILGRLTDADPVARRRMVLLVALLGLVASITMAAAVGAWLLSRNPVDDLSLAPPADVDAFVLSSRERVAALPAFRLVVRAEGHLDTEYFFNGVGVVREEYGDSPSLFGWTFIAHPDHLDGRAVWVVSEGDWGNPLSRLSETIGTVPANCAAGWEHIELAYLIERPTHHVRCRSDDPDMQPMDIDLWLDIETGLALRSGLPAFQQSESGSLEPIGQAIREVVALEFGPQPADLFVLDGETLSAAAFACATEGQCESPQPSGPLPSATPLVTPPPAPDPGVEPPDLEAYVASVLASYAGTTPIDMLIDPADAPNVSHPSDSRWRRDGLGNYWALHYKDPNDPAKDVIHLTTGGRAYETDPRPDGRIWRDWGPRTTTLGGPPTMGLTSSCGANWEYLGDDIVLDRAAVHLKCGFQEYWVDREWLLVTRAHDHDPLLADDPGAGLSQVTAVSFEPQPSELFAVPSPDLIWSSP